MLQPYHRPTCFPVAPAPHLLCLFRSSPLRVHIYLKTALGPRRVCSSWRYPRPVPFLVPVLFLHSMYPQAQIGLHWTSFEMFASVALQPESSTLHDNAKLPLECREICRRGRRCPAAPPAGDGVSSLTGNYCSLLRLPLRRRHHHHHRPRPHRARLRQRQQ